MKSHTAAQIREQVRKLLDANRVHRAPVRVELIARNLAIQVRRVPFEGDVSGALYRDKDKTVIGVNSLHHQNRQRFTIAHEIGHLLLHEMNVHVDKGYRIVLRDSSSSQATDPLEVEANQFAAELLMPETLLRGDFLKWVRDFEDEAGLRQLAALYRVSTQAMAFRLAKLRLAPLTNG